MIVFPNCKVNLGLNVAATLPNGYHEVETVMVPIPWCDVLEVVPAAGNESTLTCSGRPVACAPEKNLVMKAYRALAERGGGLPPVDMYLRKIVSDGAGLGGGSADAAFTIVALNDLFALGLSKPEMAAVAATVGADCPFFVYNEPMLATGTGTTLHPIAVDLRGLHLAVAKPEGRSVSTAEAYAGVAVARAERSVASVVAEGPQAWRHALRNDFEPSVGERVPEVLQLREHFYECGAEYASMSGSGSAVFGLFASAKMADDAVRGLEGCATWTGTPLL